MITPAKVVAEMAAWVKRLALNLAERRTAYCTQADLRVAYNTRNMTDAVRAGFTRDFLAILPPAERATAHVFVMEDEKGVMFIYMNSAKGWWGDWIGKYGPAPIPVQAAVPQPDPTQPDPAQPDAAQPDAAQPDAES
jgi:hypothetical protein